jgi:hypothetical protein
MQKCIMLAMLVMVAGCVSTIDPATGKKGYAMKPAVAEFIDGVGTTAETAAPLTGGVVGIGLGAIATMFGCYKKWRKPLVEKTLLVDKVTAGLRAAGDVIETVVKSDPKLWEKAKPSLRLAEKNGAIMPDKV